jgi:hypothetical protein
MKPKFTDQSRYPRGYVRSESTDITKTWALAREKIAQSLLPVESNVLKLKHVVTHC